jgi:hypothetical protein
MRMCTVDFKERVCTGKAGGVERALQKTRMRTLSLRLGGGALGKGGGVLRAAALAHLPGGGEGAAAEN